MFITENYDTRIENDKLRMEIIRKIMNIYDTKVLKIVLTFADINYSDEIQKHPYTIVEVANEMDLMDAVKIMDVVKNMDMNTGVIQQMYNAFSMAINSYTGAGQEV